MLNLACYEKISLFLIVSGFTYVAFRWFSGVYTYFRKLRLVGNVDGLYCYPVSACSGMENKIAMCTVKGLRMIGAIDEQFIIGKESDEKFAVSSPGGTVKEYYSSKLRNIRSLCNGSDLLLYSTDGDTFVLPLKTSEQTSTLQLHRAENIVRVCDLGDDVAKWLNGKLSLTKLRLYQVLSDVICVTPGRSSYGNYVFATRESVDYVNKSIGLEPKLKSIYFRPNIILSGCSPFDETNWTYLQIGRARFQVSGTDSRIISTSTNAQNIDWKPCWEVSPALSNDLIIVNGYNFSANIGINAKVLVEGEINLGDPVYAAY